MLAGRLNSFVVSDHHLPDPKDSEGVVLLFFCVHPPAAKAKWDQPNGVVAQVLYFEAIDSFLPRRECSWFQEFGVSFTLMTQAKLWSTSLSQTSLAS